MKSFACSSEVTRGNAIIVLTVNVWPDASCLRERESRSLGITANSPTQQYYMWENYFEAQNCVAFNNFPRYTVPYHYQQQIQLPICHLANSDIGHSFGFLILGNVLLPWIQRTYLNVNKKAVFQGCETQIKKGIL